MTFIEKFFALFADAAVERSIHEEELDYAREASQARFQAMPAITSTWVARAQDDDLPTFATHQGAHAYRAQENRTLRALGHTPSCANGCVC